MTNIFSFCLLLCLLLAFGVVSARGQATPMAQPRPEPSAQPRPEAPSLAQAESLLGAGRADAAIAVLKAIEPSEPNRLALNRLLGLAHYQKNDFARAVEYLSLSLKSEAAGSREYRRSVQLLGMAHYFLGQIKDAVPYLEQVNGWAPDNVELAYTLGVSYAQSHNPDKARAAFARMFRVAPDSAAAYLINAQMLVRQRLEEFAEKELRKAIELDPKLPQAHFLLGEMAIYRANLDLGIELLQKEITLNPGFGMAYYRLGEALTRQLKWDEAVGPLQKSIWLNPYFSGPYIVLGKVYLKKGELVSAEGILRRALQMDPNNFSGHHLLAQVLQQANRPDEAKREFEAAERLRAGGDRDPQPRD